ncbi:MAG: hypothetical protein A2504_00400 [Bdellovibrionales bacterium RIFOXYD12_FULL_39_22]|nr:MAG: hypothetical protein A2385_13980 [Bdellovibrionales bacterium RIFOXYB1_FULL_39_21]OFZ42441.1 MAG: hypothetical protein A2485_04030 [Bdellovibrionales bacterium RIFOXYC12_FULL_39_17]OFZ45417.1 MAG: hypothetical protein A2404_01470 [Bdellovibrionales bacterium RIFOXYC1_FULL_39_130]OFZ68423.1 MAG: hypothetical protein A2451_01575 [Bdellovibrionales bacterium RIFOXYC2_FULL_39_8]OFZ74614.1 MAG: hypothetical protein A2560_09500 [Bdellovibrionales bacterium RIFOXYD1_FULL_39_84]OFZ92896.1 MAG:
MSCPKVFIPAWPYTELMNIIGQWKIIDVASLKELCSYKMKKHNFLLKIRNLEKAGLISGVRDGRKQKHVYLTSKGVGLSEFNKSDQLCDENITHDIIASNVLRKLLAFANFFNGRMCYAGTEDKVLPDAEIEAIRQNKKYTLAIEVELTQKASSRIKEKFGYYALSKRYDFCLFITNKPQLCKAYLSYLREMDASVVKRIVFMVDRTMTVSEFNFFEADCFYMGNQKKFIEIFGD